MDQNAQGCGAYHIQAAAKIATKSAKYRSNHSDRADQKVATPTPPGPEAPISSLAKLYQNAIASAVHAIADRKKSFGRGKNETNIRLSLRSEDLRRRQKTPGEREFRHSGMVR